MRVLAGDIGGTHARLALVDVDGGRASIVCSRVVDSHSVTGLPELVRQFRAREPMDGVERGCFAVAAAPIDGEWRAPNLPWTIPTALDPQAMGLSRVTIVNDFEAAGHAVPLLAPPDLATLQQGSPEPDAPRALIGPGTGLGMAFLLRDGDGYRVHSSEGGHADFAPRTTEECELLTFLRGRHGRVSTERVLSGSGLAALYDFVLARGNHAEQQEVRAAMDDGEDRGVVVTRHALDGSDPLCVEAMTIFGAVFGAAAGNLVLTTLATGGIYLSGGIAPHIVQTLRDGPFLSAFGDKGRLSGLLTRTPVHVILRTDAGLIGSAAVAASANG